MFHARSGWLEALHAVSHAIGAAEDEDDSPVGEPEYGDLLDADWLERTADALELDDELVDVGLTLDLNEGDDADEHAFALDLDVGTLLTSLPPAGVARDLSVALELDAVERELGDGTLALGALRDVLLPEERALRQRADDDEEIGEDDRFPAFETYIAELPAEPEPEDGGSEGEA
jgi:hypothetical protein